MPQPFVGAKDGGQSGEHLVAQDSMDLGVSIGTFVSKDVDFVVQVGRLAQHRQYDAARGDARVHERLRIPRSQHNVEGGDISRAGSYSVPE